MALCASGFPISQNVHPLGITIQGLRGAEVDNFGARGARGRSVVFPCGHLSPSKGMNKKILLGALFAAVLLPAGATFAMGYGYAQNPFVFVNNPMPMMQRTFSPQPFFFQQPVFFQHPSVFVNNFPPPMTFGPAPFFNPSVQFLNQPPFFNQPMNNFMFNNDFGFGGMHPFPFGGPFYY